MEGSVMKLFLLPNQIKRYEEAEGKSIVQIVREQFPFVLPIEVWEQSLDMNRPPTLLGLASHG